MTVVTELALALLTGTYIVCSMAWDARDYFGEAHMHTHTFTHTTDPKKKPTQGHPFETDKQARHVVLCHKDKFKFPLLCCDRRTDHACHL